MKMILPEDYINELRLVLGSDTEKYLQSFEKEPFRGISVNLLKTTPEKLLPLLGFETERTPFYSCGYYIPPETESIGNSPLHHAGGFYVQEPSASSAAELLCIENGDYVLDLCAAPGGKSAQIASLLGGSGLIWSNEPIRNRARILLSTHERMGIANGVVSSCYPDELCPRVEGCFDKVLVDAPCSGEGMFRKNNDAITEWSREHVISCAARQLSILQTAAAALREGGILVYSTCTFSPEENEMTVKKFLESCPEFESMEINEPFGRKTELSNAVRVTPAEGGEGHFAARFRKKGNAVRRPLPTGKVQTLTAEMKKLTEDFLDDIFRVRPETVTEIMKDSIFLRPKGLEGLKAPGILRCGIYAGDIVKRRIEPAHSLFTTAEPSSLRRVLELGIEDIRTAMFLRGEEISCDLDKGYTAVAIEGMITGFGKCSGGRLKNKYPKGLRNTC